MIIKPSPKCICESPRLRRSTNYVFIPNKIFAHSTQLLSTRCCVLCVSSSMIIKEEGWKNGHYGSACNTYLNFYKDGEMEFKRIWQIVQNIKLWPSILTHLCIVQLTIAQISYPLIFDSFVHQLCEWNFECSPNFISCVNWFSSNLMKL